MYSQKNRNKSFIYEEEIDQLNREKSTKKNDSKKDVNKESHPELKDLCLKVQSEDIKLDTEKISFLYPFLKENSKDIKKKKVILPKWIERNYLDLYFAILSNVKLPKLDLNHTKKLISICEYFKNEDLIITIVHEFVFPALDKFSCLRILKDFSERLEFQRPIYFEIVERCYDIASKNIFYIINTQQSELALLKEDALENVIEKYFKSVNHNTNIDHSLIIRLMINLRKLNDIFELLEHERRRSLTNFEKIIEDGLVPINWKVNSGDIVKFKSRETDEFTYENISFCVLTSYDHEKDIYQISIKITKVDDENQDNENNNLVFSILSFMEIKEINYRSKINFSCVYNHSNTKTLVAKIEKFSSLLPPDQIDFNMKIYLSLSYNFSSIISHICRNFYEYHSLPSISKIPKTLLNLITKNKNLNVRNEDEKLFSIITYLSYRQSSNLENVEDLFNSIKWKNVSLDGLLEFILNESKILLCSVGLQEILINEFRRRFKEDNVSLNQSTEEIKSKSPSFKNLNPISKSKEKMPAMSPVGTFTSELVIKLISKKAYN